MSANENETVAEIDLESAFKQWAKDFTSLAKFQAKDQVKIKLQILGFFMHLHNKLTQLLIISIAIF